MKRTCEGCVADKHASGAKYCSLRYRRRLVRIAKGVEVFCAPDEECPKPRTWKEYWETSERKGKGRR